jgi:hypothetical protein
MGRGLPASRCMTAIAVFFLSTLLFMLLLSTRAGASSRFDPGPGPTPIARIYFPAISGSIAGTRVFTASTFLPLLYHQRALPYSCPSSSAATWADMTPNESWISGAARSPDLNMNVRGWIPVEEAWGFVRYPYPPDEPPDTLHPLHLSNIAGSTGASFVSAYQVNEWDWEGNRAVPRPSRPYSVTMLGLRTDPGQPLHIASRDVKINPAGYTAMVLYADAGQIALTYTWDDRVDTGYLLHLVNLCVDPNLVALYQRLTAEGRDKLPAVTNLSVIGTAAGYEVDVIVRDSGAFLDPRSYQDWWQDQPAPARWVR